MTVPASRADFKEYCLRSLGKPVINIDVEDTQVDDRIDEALRYYWDYHFDGTQKIYYKYQITETDQTNRYITIPDNIIGAVNIFPIGFYQSQQANMFNVQYQIALNDLYTLTSFDLVPFYMMMQHLNVLQEVLVGVKPIRYNRHQNRLYVDMNWQILEVGQWLVVEAYQVIDPDEFTDAWGDRWLLEYATALIKRQWGNNLGMKYTGVKLPNGVEVDGKFIIAEAKEQIKELRDEMINSYSLPVTDMIG
jgi:hypothetical protein